MKRTVLLFLLLGAVLLQGCMIHIDFDPEPSDPTLPITTQTQPETTYHTPETEVWERPYESLLEPTRFSEIAYSRPDADALREAFSAVQSLVEQGGSLEAVIAAYEDAYDDYLLFNTMATVAYIRYCLDLSDSYYDTEYNWCEEQSPLINQSVENCYIAMGESDLRNDLETELFEEGFFEFYDENRIYSNDRVVELMQRESELETQYMALQNDQTVEWDGVETSVDALLSDSSLTYFDYFKILELYYDKYNTAAGELFIQLIGVRKQIAEELDYDSYADFAYEYTYERDYTPTQTAVYLNDIAQYLVPLSDLSYSSYDTAMDADEVMAQLDTVTAKLGGMVRVAYESMIEYELYDFTASSRKMTGSFTTYLEAYELPYVFITPTGTDEDLMTAAHEFGHYVDGYANCNGTSAVDCAEIFSQALEFLTLGTADLTAYERSATTAAKLGDSLSVFLSQASYADFEQQAYALPEEELTLERLNEIFLESCEKYDCSTEGMETYIARAWVDVQHFFIAPYYVISYCVSNDAALQVYQCELAQSGAGLERYVALLQNSSGNSILALLEEAGMDSPFAEGRMRELAEFFREQLD